MIAQSRTITDRRLNFSYRIWCMKEYTEITGATGNSQRNGRPVSQTTTYAAADS